MKDSERTAQRKLDHVRINLEESVSSTVSNGLERYRFEPTALPEIDLDAVDIATQFLGRPLAVPLLVSSMTGGAEGLVQINQRLAEAAQARGLAMGVGSQRSALESERVAVSYRVRDLCPDVVLLANLGAVQLNYGYGLDACRRAVEMIEADGLVLHLNALQEALQPEGDTRWSGLLGKIAEVVAHVGVPVVIKEVGWGISAATARQLADIGVAVIDVAGAGGTSWSEVERHRASTIASGAVAEAFAGWGIPTAESIVAVRTSAPEVEVIASGGLRNGVDVAKAIALGSQIAGMAGPFLKAAHSSTDAILEHIDVVATTLRIAMFAAGITDLPALRGTRRLVEVPR